MFSYKTILKSCIAFKLNSNQSNGELINIADMNYPRNCHSLLPANGKLYAIGGYVFIEYLTLSDDHIFITVKQIVLIEIRCHTSKNTIQS